MSENPLNSIEAYKSLESLKSEASERLHHILNKPLTVENIEVFADEALNDSTNLIGDLLHEYQTNPNLEGDKTRTVQEQEDAVCEKLGLLNIPQILDLIQLTKNRISDLKKYVEETKQELETIITPTDQLETTDINTGDGIFEKRKFIPRLLTLIYILEADFDINVKDKGEVQIIEGDITDSMMRQIPYMRVMIPSLNRVVYICDEEGNASYVFDTEKLKQTHMLFNDLDNASKNDKNLLIATHAGVGVRVIQNPNWRDNMGIYLSQDLATNPSGTIDGVSEAENGNEDLKNEKEQLTYEKLCLQIKNVWEGIPDDKKPTNLVKWYENERTKERNTTGLYMVICELNIKINL